MIKIRSIKDDWILSDKSGYFSIMYDFLYFPLLREDRI